MSQLPPRILARAETLLREHGKYNLFGIRMAAPTPVAERAEINGRECYFNWCDSELQIRELLVARESDEAPQFILTNLNHRDLGQDLIARFAKRTFFTDDVWQTLQSRLRARQTDPMLKRHRWLAEMLIEGEPPAGYRAAPGGVLDAETVWGLALKEHFGFDGARPDTRDLLAWTTEPEKIARYLDASEDCRKGLRERLRESAGALADCAFDCLEAGSSADALPLGLACHVVFSQTDDPAIETALRGAAIRMEQFTGGRSITKTDAAVWRNAAVSLVEWLSQNDRKAMARRALDRADEILWELKIAEYAWLSSHSLKGLDQALERYGARLLELLKDEFTEIPEDLPQLADTIFRHREAFDGLKRTPRAETVEMSLRLLRWLAQERRDCDSFEEAALAYARDGAFADRARQSLYRGDPVAKLSEAYQRLAEVGAARREGENQRFAELLAKWTEAGSRGESVVKIEDVLGQVVAEVAKSSPILLIVMDGMGYAVFHELIEDITERGWIEIAPEGKGWPVAAIAALPSITEVSRASLLCGKLTKGSSADEAAGFESHEALRNIARAKPPVLFHKNRLTEAGRNELAADLCEELASEKRKIVGVVVNAVDDHLLKGEQLNVSWDLNHIPVLEHLLYAARDAGRAVIITADHGHVLNWGTAYRQSAPTSRLSDEKANERSDEKGERYRSAEGAPEEDELLISGTRVVPGKIIAPWSEQVRYAMKKHGYHGGLTPQECVVPCCVLVRYNQKLERLSNDWSERPLHQPAWWSRPEPARPGPVLASTTLAETQARRPRKALAGMPLFAEAEARGVEWIDRLFASDVYEAQRKLAGRGAPKPEDARKFLELLAERGGKTLRLTMAQHLGLPELRIAGMIAAMRRILNVDGYAVLDFEEPLGSIGESSGTICLNINLLRTQFGLDDK
jgi:hypothetical protein